MKEKKRKGLAELEAIEVELDRKAEERKREHAARLDDPRVQLGIEAVIRDNLDALLDPAADAITASIIRLAEMLAKLDLISKENPGTLRWRADLGTGELVDGIEADHPDGTRLYTVTGVDTIIASRMRDVGRFRARGARRARLADRVAHGLPAGAELMTSRVNGQRRVEMRDNAAVVASGVNKESWSV